MPSVVLLGEQGEDFSRFQPATFDEKAPFVAECPSSHRCPNQAKIDLKCRVFPTLGINPLGIVPNTKKHGLASDASWSNTTKIPPVKPGRFVRPKAPAPCRTRRGGTTVSFETTNRTGRFSPFTCARPVENTIDSGRVRRGRTADDRIYNQSHRIQVFS